MLILPLIDLFVLAGSALLGFGFLLKVMDLAMSRPMSLLGFSSLDFVMMAGVCWGFALVLAARTWVKLHEPDLYEMRRRQLSAEAKRRADAYDPSLDAAGTALEASADDIRKSAEPRRP
jgi:hypothetical protein